MVVIVCHVCVFACQFVAGVCMIACACACKSVCVCVYVMCVCASMFLCVDCACLRVFAGAFVGVVVVRGVVSVCVFAFA